VARKKTIRKSTPKADSRAKAPAAPARVAASATPGVSQTPPTVAAASSSEVGIVTHYFPRVDAAVVEVGPGELHTGDTVHFRGHTTDFYQTLDRLEVDHQPVDVARPGQQVGVHVSHRVREGDRHPWRRPLRRPSRQPP
jgi:putative protease